MSRVARDPIQLPKGVEVKLDGRDLTVKGGMGSLALTLKEGIQFKEEDGVLIGFGRLAQNDLEILVPLVRRVRLTDLHLTSHNQSKTYSNDVIHAHCTRTST